MTVTRGLTQKRIILLLGCVSKGGGKTIPQISRTSYVDEEGGVPGSFFHAGGRGAGHIKRLEPEDRPYFSPSAPSVKMRTLLARKGLLGPGILLPMGCVILGN